MSRIHTYEELKEIISREYPDMSKQLQRIAHFALDRPNDLALGTVATIAAAAGVQPSAMIRFANALGFGGFSEMQLIFRGHLVEKSASYRERITQIRGEQSRGGNGAPTGVLNQFVGESMNELGHLEESIRADDFQAAVRLLSRAKRIHVLAQRRSFPVACYLSYALSQLELKAHLLDGVGGMVREAARSIAPDEVLIAVSFRNYSPDVIDIAAGCRQRGVPVIGITDTTLSPLKPVSDVCFELGDDSQRQFRSLVGPLCLAQALVVSTGYSMADQATKKAERKKPVEKVDNLK